MFEQRDSALKVMVFRRMRIAEVIALIISTILLLRLFQLCVIERETYTRLAEANRQRIIPIEPQRGIIYDRNGVPLVKNLPYFVAQLSPEYTSEGQIQEIADLLKIPKEEILEKIKNRRSEIEPITIKEGLSFEEVARIEARHSDYPGLSVSTTFIRRYLYGSIGAHLIGYLGRITKEQWEFLRQEGVPQDAFVGQWGVEKVYDDLLRGRYGKKIVEVDALGNEVRLLQVVPPEKGQDITLSIDIEVQKAMEEAYQGRAGAFVAIDPNTGEVLALGSLPSFDPNRFSRGADPDYWRQLSQDPWHPFINRAFQAQYPPGSVFKIVVAIAGLEEGIIKPSTTYTCSGGIPFGNRFFRCWKKEGHGTVNLKRAIVESCDVYFYEVGRILGIDRIAEYARRLGLGQPSGIKLVSERKGIVPSTEWKIKTLGQPWYPGETLSAAIGQSYVSATLVQLARMIGAVANGGYLKELRLLRKTEEINSPQSMVQEISINISQETLNLIRDALKGVVNEPGGTGGAARLQGIYVGGKTGTAQVISKAIETHKLAERERDHAWFVAFAPVENPQIAMTVFVEHGGQGGSVAAPIARAGLESFFRIKKMAIPDHQGD